MKRLFGALLGVLVVVGSAQAADKAETFEIDRVMGKADAPLTIIEYASTTCGHCGTFHTQVLPEIKRDFIDTGKVKLIFRDFPTNPAGMSIGASMIAHCAAPDQYFGVLGLFMANQERWMKSQQPLDTIKTMVRLAGLSGEQVDACLKRQDLSDAIQKRAQRGSDAFGINSTPSLVIGSEVISGAQSYDTYKKAIESALK